MEAGPHAAHRSRALIAGRVANDEIRFGRTVTVYDRDAEAAGERFVIFGGHAGRQSDAHVMTAFLVGRRARKQHRNHRAQQVSRGRSVPDEAGEKIRNRKPSLDDQRRSRQQRLVEGVERIGVKQRQRRQQYFAVAEPEQRGGVRRPPEILRLRAADAFRRPRRSRSVENRDRVARPRGMRGNRLARRGQRRDSIVRGNLEVRLADDPKPIQRRSAAPGRDDGREEFRVDDREPRAAIAEDVLELRAARGGVDRNRDDPRPGASEIDLHQRGSVAADDGDPVARSAGRRRRGAPPSRPRFRASGETSKPSRPFGTAGGRRGDPPVGRA